jgi:hypothetical protein
MIKPSTAFIVAVVLASQALLEIAVRKTHAAELDRFAACEAIVRYALSQSGQQSDTTQHFVGTHMPLARDYTQIHNFPDSFYSRFNKSDLQVLRHSAPHIEDVRHWNWILDDVQTGGDSYAIIGSYACGPWCFLICGYSVKKQNQDWKVTVHNCLTT